MAIITFLTEGHLPESLRVTGIALAALVAVPFAHTLRLSIASRRWPNTEGSIVSSRVVDCPDSEFADIRYSYSVDGCEYSGSRVHFGPPLSQRLFTGAADEAASYRAGASVRVFYDPTRPERSVLEPGPRALTLVLLASAVAAIVFLAWPWLASQL